jgi:hypothetical protein
MVSDPLAEVFVMSQSRPTRRQFNKRAALLAAAPLAVAAAPAAAAPVPQAGDLPAAAETNAAQAAALTSIVRGRHGKSLTDDQLKRVQQRIGFGLVMARRLRDFRVTEHDEPATVFPADVP